MERHLAVSQEPALVGGRYAAACTSGRAGAGVRLAAPRRMAVISSAEPIEVLATALDQSQPAVLVGYVPVQRALRLAPPGTA